MKSSMTKFTLSLLLLFPLAACGGSQAAKRQKVEQRARPRALVGSDQPLVSDKSRCNPDTPDREMSEYDTSGDRVPDVRKIFLRIGKAAPYRLVLICRETDINGDGVKDVVRYYDDAGLALREEADRNLDGRMDEVTFFERGIVVRQEFDANHDGKVDTKIFFKEEKPFRAERDLRGRSTASKWLPDRWEYYDGERVVRMGTDLDGDSKVDRWDRNEALTRNDEGGDFSSSSLTGGIESGSSSFADAPNSQTPTQGGDASPEEEGDLVTAKEKKRGKGKKKAPGKVLKAEPAPGK